MSSKARHILLAKQVHHVAEGDTKGIKGHFVPNDLLLYPILVAEMGCGANSTCKRSAQGQRERAYERYAKARVESGAKTNAPRANGREHTPCM